MFFENTAIADRIYNIRKEKSATLTDFCIAIDMSVSTVSNYMTGKRPPDAKFLYAICEVFKVNIGERKPCVLHTAQSQVLKKLLEGKSVAVSAPTSFGKSFVIDAFIKIKKPKNVVIIVPTIALTDETRRRIHKKFAHEYKILEK